MGEQATRRLIADDELTTVPKRHLVRVPHLLRLALGLVWRAAPRQFWIMAALQAAAGFGLAGQLLLAKQLLDRVVDTDRASEVRSVLSILIAFGVVTAVVSFVTVVRAEQQRLLGEMVARYTVRQVVDAACAVELISFEDPDFHDRLQRAHLNAVTRPLQLVAGLLGVLSAGVAIAGIATALFLIEPVLVLVILLGLIPGWFVTTRSSSLLYDLMNRQTGLVRQRNYLVQSLAGKEAAAEVRAFGLSRFLRDRLDVVYDNLIEQMRRLVRKRIVLGLVGSVLAAASTVGALGLLLWFVWTDRMPLASAGVAAAGIVLLSQRLRGLAGSSGSLYEGSLFLDNFTAFVASVELRAPHSSASAAPRGFEVLRTHGVSFTYPSRDTTSVCNVSMEIRRGEVVALVGENGSGKTTLAKLLAGLYRPEAGAITWDGQDTAAMDPDTVRDRTAVIFQDFIRYFLPAAENIGLGRPEWIGDRQRVVAAARLAGAHDGVLSLADGYDSLLGPEFAGGSDLSGGQWQLIALARAFFRDAPFVILDEPTAALDPRAEYELFESVRRLLKGRSVLLISHRFSSVRSADRIYVMKDGGILESGDHGTLMARSGLYYELFTLQASAYLKAT